MTNAEKHYIKMTETPVASLIMRLGLPTTVSMLITNIYNLADTYFVGALGESAQAATGILFTLQCIIQAIAFMLGHGSGSFVSRSLASRDNDKASEYVSSAFFSGAVMGTALMLLGLIFMNPLLRLLGSTDTILPYAKDYGLWVLIACPFMVCSLILNNNLRYEGIAMYAMIGLTSGGILNIFGDYVLIRICDMGVYGAGLATAVSQLVSFTILLIMYFRKAQSKIRLRYMSRQFEVYISILKVGFPSFIRQGLSSVSNGLLNNFTKPFGDAAIAAMSVVSRFARFVMCVGLGIGQGFQPVSAFNYQAGKYSRVKKGLLFTMGFSFCFIAVLAATSFTFATEIVSSFNKSEEVIAIGTKALHFTMIGMLFFPISTPVTMLYQSIGEAGKASFLSILRAGAFLIPMIVILIPMLGLLGVQIVQPAADVLTGLVSIPFILSFIRHLPEDKA